MGTIQKLSSQVIDYAERVSQMADIALGQASPVNRSERLAGCCCRRPERRCTRS